MKYIRCFHVKSVGSFEAKEYYDGIVFDADVQPVVNGYIIQGYFFTTAELEMCVPVTATTATLDLSKLMNGTKGEKAPAPAKHHQAFLKFYDKQHDMIKDAIKMMRKAKAIYDFDHALQRFESAGEFIKAAYNVASRDSDMSTCRELSQRLGDISMSICLDIYDAPTAKELKISITKHTYK